MLCLKIIRCYGNAYNLLDCDRHSYQIKLPENRYMTNCIYRIILALMAILMGVFSSGAADRKSNAESTPAEKVILDCDMGDMNDDALALSLLLQAEKQGGFVVSGITLEGGNLFIAAAFEMEGALQTSAWENTKAFLESIGRRDIPVYRGTDYPEGFNEKTIFELTEYFKNADYLPYNDGYGAIHAFENTVSGTLCDSDDAADFMISCVKANPGKVVIIATGPTMNIAKAIKKDPSFAENVKAVYYMGGALGESYEAETIAGKMVKAIAGANVTPYSEYNVLYDPLSFYTCITAGFPQQFLTPAELSADFDRDVIPILEACVKDSKMACKWYQQYENSLPAYPYWDPVTVFSYLRPACVMKADEKYITVNTDRKDDRFGETTAINADEYSALSALDKQRYGKLTVISEVENFWDETIRLLCSP